MISDEAYKKSLGEARTRLTEEQIAKLRNVQYGLANIFFDLFVLKGKKNVIGGGILVSHKKNGNWCTVSVVTYSYSYAY
jgi:hypothetical protein